MPNNTNNLKSLLNALNRVIEDTQDKISEAAEILAQIADLDRESGARAHTYLIEQLREINSEIGYDQSSNDWISTLENKE